MNPALQAPLWVISKLVGGGGHVFKNRETKHFPKRIIFLFCTKMGLTISAKLTALPNKLWDSVVNHSLKYKSLGYLLRFSHTKSQTNWCFITSPGYHRSFWQGKNTNQSYIHERSNIDNVFFLFLFIIFIFVFIIL